jgi:hypothetical protein
MGLVRGSRWWSKETWVACPDGIRLSAVSVSRWEIGFRLGYRKRLEGCLGSREGGGLLVGEANFPGKAHWAASWEARKMGLGWIRMFLCVSGLIFLNQRADSEKNLDPNWMSNCVTADCHVRGGFFHLRTMFSKAR